MAVDPKDSATRDLFPIEKGVPCPPPRGGKGRRGKYPIADLRPGESFFVPFAEGNYNSVSSCVSSFRRRRGGSYAVRREEAGTRVFCL